MSFIIKNYDKILLFLILIGFIVTLVWLIFVIQEAKETGEEEFLVREPDVPDYKPLDMEQFKCAQNLEVDSPLSKLWRGKKNPQALYATDFFVPFPAVRDIKDGWDFSDPRAFYLQRGFRIIPDIFYVIEKKSPFGNWYLKRSVEREDVSKIDTDEDGIPDNVEKKLGMDAHVKDVTLDLDGDSFQNIVEINQNTDPDNPKDHPPLADRLIFIDIQPKRLPFKVKSVLKTADKIDIQADVYDFRRRKWKTKFLKEGDIVELSNVVYQIVKVEHKLIKMKRGEIEVDEDKSEIILAQFLNPTLNRALNQLLFSNIANRQQAQQVNELFAAATQTQLNQAGVEWNTRLDSEFLTPLKTFLKDKDVKIDGFDEATKQTLETKSILKTLGVKGELEIRELVDAFRNELGKNSKQGEIQGPPINFFMARFWSEICDLPLLMTLYEKVKDKRIVEQTNVVNTANNYYDVKATLGELVNSYRVLIYGKAIAKYSQNTNKPSLLAKWGKFVKESLDKEPKKNMWPALETFLVENRLSSKEIRSVEAIALAMTGEVPPVTAISDKTVYESREKIQLKDLFTGEKFSTFKTDSFSLGDEKTGKEVYLVQDVLERNKVLLKKTDDGKEITVTRSARFNPPQDEDDLLDMEDDDKISNRR